MSEAIKHEIGAIIEARCAKCKAVTSHNVLELKKTGSAKKVCCEKCGYEHAYRQPRVTKKGAGTATKKLTVAEKKKIKAEAEFDAMVNAVPKETIVPYAPTASFQLDSFVEHPVFGVGKVEELITPDKVVVQFREGSKVLVCIIKPEIS